MIHRWRPARDTLLLLGLAAVACAEGVVSGGRPLGIAITATPPQPTVGDSVEFVVEASGANLIILRLEFGDGARDSLSAQGAVGATLRRKHAYDEPGTYVASGSVLDVSDSGLTTVADSVVVEVSPR